MKHNTRLLTVLFFFVLIFGALIYRSSVLTLGEENREKVNLVLMNREPVSLEKLNNHVENLERMTSNINEYSFSKIEAAIRETITLVNFTNRELNAQYNAWLEVKGKIREDSTSFQKLKNDLRKIQKMQGQEILALKKLLDEAEQPNSFADGFNLALTFTLGIMSSLIATLMKPLITKIRGRGLWNSIKEMMQLRK